MVLDDDDKLTEVGVLVNFGEIYLFSRNVSAQVLSHCKILCNNFNIGALIPDL